MELWSIILHRKVEKDLKKLSKKAKIQFAALIKEMETEGPYRTNWPHYGPFNNKGNFHCHLRGQRRPTYVVCWRNYTSNKRIEIYYVGSHENSPY